MKHLLAFVLLLSSSFVASAASRPNILLILVDDLKPTLGAYGDRTAITPNLDRLVGRGLRFDAAYCNQAVCASSRFSLLLGARSTTTGLYQFGRNFRDTYPDAVTLPQFFMRHGYRTESMGKVFHVGHGTSDDPASWSLPVHKDLVIEYVDPASTRDGSPTNEQALFTNLRRPPGSGPLPRGAAWESPDVPDDAYADARVATHAISRLRAAQEKPAEPFFLAVGFVRPHLPFSVPKKYWDLYDPAQLPMPARETAPEGVVPMAMKRGGEIDAFFPVPKPPVHPYPDDLKRKLIHGYYASMSYADVQIGRVMAALDELKLADHTIVVLWGDHGWHLGEHNFWGKHNTMHLAIRVPLLVRVPGKTPGNTASIVETSDIFPTLCALAGIEPPATVQGRPFTSLLDKPQSPFREAAYSRFVSADSIITERFHYTSYQNGKADMLYDLKKDPQENENVADKPEHAVTLAKMKTLLQNRMEEAAKLPLK